LRHGVQFTPDQHALIREAIASGRLHGPEDAMQQALLLGKNVNAAVWKFRVRWNCQGSLWLAAGQNPRE
jgi:hypothetical protein